MKKLFILSTLLIVLLLSAFKSSAQKTIDMNVYNLVQINETEIRFDVRIKNTTADPATTGAIAIAAWAIKLDFNSQLNNGFTNAIVAAYVGNTGLTAGENTPTPGTTSYNTNITTGNYFQAYAGSASNDQAVTLLADANWLNIGTFKLQCKNVSALRNWLSYAPNIAYNPGTFTGVNECEYYDDGSGNFLRVAGSPDIPVTVNRQLTLPNNSIPLASYVYSGTGNWSLTTNWNKVCTNAANGKNVIPVAGSSVQLGAYSTIAVPVLTTGLVTFDATPANISLSTLTMKGNSTLTVTAAKQLTVTGTLTKENALATALTLKSDATGTASLKNSTAGVTATIERYIPAWTTNAGYHLLSSPVSGQLIATNFTNATPANYDFYLYNPAAAPNVWINYKGTNFSTMNGGLSFVTGKGYLASYLAAATHNFAGTMNVANVTPTLAPSAGFNLVGNPYACAIQGNMSTFSPSGMNSNVWVLDGATNSYRSWNGTTGTLGFTGEIPAMQGFFVQATSAGASITIPASAKMHSASNFYKTTLDNHLELKVQSPNNTIDATVIYFKDENSNDVDSYDAMLMPSANPENAQIYSYINSDKYCIDALAAYSGPYTVNVGFEPKVDGNFTITAEDVQSFNTNSTITLLDLATGATQNLRANPTYTFAATTTQAINRFKLVFDLVVGINNMNAVANAVYSFDNSIYIKTTEKVKSVSVFNMLGQEVENIQQPTSNVLTLNQATGYYTVRVITEANVYSQKVYIK